MKLVQYNECLISIVDTDGTWASVAIVIPFIAIRYLTFFHFNLEQAIEQTVESLVI